MKIRAVHALPALSVAAITLAVPTSPALADTGSLTATLDGVCSNYGLDVVNSTTAAHTVVLTINGAAQSPTVVAAGSTSHLPIATSTPAATPVLLTDSDATVVYQGALRFCITFVNRAVTLKSGATFTLPMSGGSLAAPAPRHGSTVLLSQGRGIRYTPNACFHGADSFGYDDSVAAQQGVVTVTVLPCAPAPRATDPPPVHTAAPVVAVASTNAELPNTGSDVGVLTSIGLAALLGGAGILFLARRRTARRNN